MKVSSVDSAMAALRQTMTKTSRRLEAVASNLANIDTPGYRAVEVRFPDLQAKPGLLRRTDGRHLPVADPAKLRGTPVEAAATRMRDDGNTVDIDREMASLNALQGRYRASAEMIRKRFALWRYAVTDGRK